MVCAPVRLIIPSLKLGDYLSVQAHKPCSISHLNVKINQNSFLAKRIVLDSRYCTDWNIQSTLDNAKSKLSRTTDISK